MSRQGQEPIFSLESHDGLRQGRLTVPNTLAYFDKELITAVKSFKVPVCGFHCFNQLGRNTNWKRKAQYS